VLPQSANPAAAPVTSPTGHAKTDVSRPFADWLAALEESMTNPAPSPSLSPQVQAARKALDQHVREIVQWHFSLDTGTPFWLEKAKTFQFNPLKDVQGFDDLKRFGHFEDDWLRGGPIRRWVPKAYQNKPLYVFETGGTTGIPKSRFVSEDHWIDYEMFSDSLPEKHFPKGANWMMLGPSGPRRLRLAVEHLCQHRGGICFCVDLDPRWVVKLIKKGWMEHLKAYQEHVIDQAMTILSANHEIKCMFTTPKLLDALCDRLLKDGKSFSDTGITGIFCGGTEMTSQWIRFTIEENLGPNVYIAPTYGNTLMGLAAAEMPTAADGYKITYYAPQPRAVAELVAFDNYDKVVDYGQEGRVCLTTLTKEFFVPRFLERDEGVRERPSAKYPWDGVSGVKPFREFAATTTVGVY
jgi:phenylacetate-coenzyme A ligase PaaK-like adenylate-forming protein